MRSVSVPYMNICYGMSKEDKKEEPSSELLALTWLFAVPCSFNHTDKSCYGYF